MGSQNTMKLKFAMEEPWYKEYWTFLMIPLLATAACYFIPIFQGGHGMNSMIILPLTAVFSYGHTLSPRHPYYENGWKEIMTYHEFILANLKRVFVFATPIGILAWIISIFLSGYPKELAMFFETTIWELAAGIFICALVSYAEEIYKLRKTDKAAYKGNLKHLWKWIVPSTFVFILLAISKAYILLDSIFFLQAVSKAYALLDIASGRT